ncbi:MAG TPA: patatin-like phospholipase family protein [Anaerolineales bacterium]|nr:patatin-like phospholipase family protein [Anaerolineales bacterium]
MAKKLAFVLSGGGSRGALQVGALYALLEAGIQPDFLIGASIGAVNSTFLAINGFSKESLDRLKYAWQHASTNDMFPANYLWLTVRAMFGRSSQDPSRRLKQFFITHGISPELRFAHLDQLNLVIVSTDLNTGQPILHGAEPEDKVLDALLLSTALPPWFMPVRKQDRYLMDGGVVSNLPVEPALKMGATEIVALDLTDSREVLGQGDRLRVFFDRLIYTVEKRQLDLELQLAEARGIPLLYIDLTGETPVPLWDFQHTDELIAQGYETARQVINSQQSTHPIL